MTRTRRIRRPVVMGLVALLLIAGVVITVIYALYLRPDLQVTGRVVSLDGTPVVGASAETPRGTATTDEDGWFQVPARRGSQWVVVTHPEFLSRTRAANPDAPVLFRLTPDDGETVSLHFGGDVMFGRRFYDPNEDGDTTDGLIQPDSGVEEHLELLEHVRPLLANAHLTAVNLESPLVRDPYPNPLLPRPARWHPTKEFVFASSPAAAAALEAAGVDVVSLGNNHMFDVLEEGVEGTVAALDEARVAHFGAGLRADGAWEAELVSARGQVFAFIGCTTVTGREHRHPILYTAAADKAGAAACERDRLREAVHQAKLRADVVIVMIHGGVEYQRAPSPVVQPLNVVAREAGATLVINHHPHVVGGFEWDGVSLTAHTLGNLLFDQTVWPTFESYVLAVHVRDGEVIRAYAEPLMIEGYVPKGVTGELADFVARGAAGRVEGPYVIEDGAMEVDLGSAARAATETVDFDAAAAGGSVHQLAPGWWLSDVSGASHVRLGRDLLWVGSFEEDQDTDTQEVGALLWRIEPPASAVSRDFAFRGELGARLSRGEARDADAVLAPIHRILVDAGMDLTFTGMFRPSTRFTLGSPARAIVQLSWYPDTRGPSSTQTIVPLDLEEGEWAPFRLDAQVPPGIVAVGVFVRLASPENGTAALEVDDVRLIEWAPVGARFNEEYDHFLIRGSGRATLVNDYLPGALPWLERTVDAPLVTVP